jgi:outer membrane protein OmpA-like peptidoglycan-associated protein/tetratricopeptide (TPR) repeat protein
MKFKSLFFLAFFALCCSIPAVAQKKTEMEKVEKLRTKKKIKVGNNLVNKGSYYNAIEVYEMVLVKKPSHTATQFKLGTTNYLIRDYGKAAEWFEKVASFDSLGYPLSTYYLAASLKRLGKYEDAIKKFETFKKTSFKKEPLEVADLKKTVAKEIDGCNFAIKSMGEKYKVKVKHLDANVNNPMSDYAPHLANDKLIFSSLRSDTIVVLDTAVNNPPAARYSRLYQSGKTGDNWDLAKPLEIPFNEESVHVGNGMYSSDGKTFVFTKCTESPELKMICKIFVSSSANGSWSTPVQLGNGINQENSSSTHPYLTKTTNGQEILYFSSDMNGGKGGMDIYYSIRNSNGEFGSPKNAGNIINTSGNEVTPYLDVKHSKLYFSSDALISMGGFDIYVSEIQNNDFTAPVNIGYPLNSSVDDLYFVHGTSDKNGFLVSNRPGGMSLKSPTCCDDILDFIYPAEFVVINGTVTDEETGKAPDDECFMYVYNIKNDSLIGTFPIAKDGTFSFKLKAGEQYKMVNSCKKYQEKVTEIDTRDLEDGAVITKDIKLKKKDLYDGKVLQYVYFDYTKYVLKKNEMAKLDSVAAFLNSREDFIVRLEGHTDQRGELDYNQKLSEQRALVAYNYLLKKKKVPAHKILHVGYGETRPVEDCSKYKECPVTGQPDCPCHEKNRRTECVLFQMVGSGK